MSLKILLEASVGKAHSGRVVEILKNRIERQTGQTLYDTKIVDTIDKEDGRYYGVFIMFSDGKHAIRLNWKTADTSSSIIGIDFWAGVTANPQYSIDTEDVNIVQIVNIIDDLVAGTQSSEITEDTKYFEAKVKNFKDVKDFLEKKGYSIIKDPAFTVRRYIVTNKKNKTKVAIRYIPTMDEMYGDIQEMGIEGFLERFDADSGSKNKSAKVKPAGKETPVPKESTPFDSLFEDPLSADEVFALLEQGVNDVIRGLSKTLIITGSPGVGKTFSVTKQLAGENSISFKGGITSAAALYKMLFVYNEPGKIIIFDDLDELFKDRECVNILKGALDSTANPEVSYISNNTVDSLYYQVLTGERDRDDPEVVRTLNKLKIDIEAVSDKRFEVMQMKAQDPFAQAAILPNKFVFKSKVIFISNLYLDELPGALVSRGGTKIEINLTLEEIVKRIESILDKLEVPVEEGTPPVGIKEKKLALKYCKEILVPYSKSGRIKHLEFRGFFDIARLASSGASWDIWTRWASRSIFEAFGDKGDGKRRAR